MEILQPAEKCRNTEAACAENAGEYRRSAASGCARAMAQLESVLRELSPMNLHARHPGHQLKNEKRDDPATIDGTKPYTHANPSAVQFGVFDLRLAKRIPDRLCLDQGLDFVVHKDGAIELTSTGFRRMAQAHSAGLEVVIGVDWREVLRFPVSIQDGDTDEHQRAS